MRYLVIFILTTFIWGATLTANAATVNFLQVSGKQQTLYQQPEASAKSIATYNAGQELISLKKQGDWVKVADPKTGNVGWMQKSALQGSNSYFTIQMYGPNVTNKTVRQTQPPQGAPNPQNLQYGASININKQQIQDVVKNFQKQQILMHEQLQKVISSFVKDWNKGVNNLPKFDQNKLSFPMIQPIIIMPAKAVIIDNKKPQTPAAKPAQPITPTTPAAIPAPAINSPTNATIPAKVNTEKKPEKTWWQRAKDKLNKTF